MMVLKKTYLLWFLPPVIVMSLGLVSTLHISQTNSLAYRVFFSNKIKTAYSSPQYGDFVVFKHEGLKKNLIKQVMGLPGDSIIFKNDTIYITQKQNSTHQKTQKLGIIQKITVNGDVLNPIKTGVIPHGKVFLRGTHERSIDSRYQHIGLIDIQRLKKVIPIL